MVKKGLEALNTPKDRCRCKHHWITHNKVSPQGSMKAKHRWCVLCDRWCGIQGMPKIYDNMK
jgi:hypothetical protein